MPRDDELKLLAIQGLQQTAPERAIPLLVKVINDVGSLRLKERALFVLAQSGAPEARATLEKVARGERHARAAGQGGAVHRHERPAREGDHAQQPLRVGRPISR